MSKTTIVLFSSDNVMFEIDEQSAMESDILTSKILSKAAYELQIKSLLDLTCETVVDMITGKTAEKIREIFNMKNDFTFEEMEEIRIEDSLGFE